MENIMNKNHIYLLGNATDSPKTYTTQSGKKFCHFTLATNQYLGKNEDGTARTRPDYHRVIAWEKTAEIAMANIQKGTYLQIEGSLHYNTYEKDGIKFTNAQIRAYSILKIASLQKADQQNSSENPESDFTPSESQITEDEVTVQGNYDGIPF
jgi:single-strand DNA-binding protein